jgi:hypothetical protein
MALRYNVMTHTMQVSDLDVKNIEDEPPVGSSTNKIPCVSVGSQLCLNNKI